VATVSYKCPNCGGKLEFKPELQKLKCEYCLSEFTGEELASGDRLLEPETAADARQLVSYRCDNCGAEVVTEENTSATFCYYCHNPVLLTDRLTGEFKPDKIVPFTFDKAKAVEQFLKWAKAKRYIPKDFTSASQLEKITGIYIPYWLADYRTEINYSGKGSEHRSWVTGNIQNTEIKEYAFERKGTVDITNIPEIAVERIERGLLDSISPFDKTGLVDFSPAYLSGFFAEKYAVGQAEVKPAMEDRVRTYVAAQAKWSIRQYSDVTLTASDLKVAKEEWHYALLPVWVLTYQYRNKTYVYAVNGQSGKAYGELPLDRRKLDAASALITVSLIALAALGGALIW